jgi:hypothetical protein
LANLQFFRIVSAPAARDYTATAGARPPLLAEIAHLTPVNVRGKLSTMLADVTAAGRAFDVEERTVDSYGNDP